MSSSWAASGITFDQTGNTGKDGTTGTSAGGGGGGGGQGGDSRAGEWWKLMFVSLVVLPQYATFQDMRPYSKTFFLGEMALEEQPGYRFPW